jgi:hypothetical protein
MTVSGYVYVTQLPHLKPKTFHVFDMVCSFMFKTVASEEEFQRAFLLLEQVVAQLVEALH